MKIPIYTHGLKDFFDCFAFQLSMLLSLQQATLSSEDQTESSGQNRKDD